MTLIETLRRICELQPHYSSDNTPEMQERGELVRRTLADHLRERAPALKTALGEFGDEFDVGASDGIGRKTEAPWVRFFARFMSPNPRTGFYCVTHFAANGSAVFITVGCGATAWANGDLRELPEAEIAAKTTWARQLVAERYGTLDPFGDGIELGAKANLPRAFERATALARRVVLRESTDAEIESIFIAAAERLRIIYEAQRIGNDLTTGPLAEIALLQLERPARQRAGQGFRLSTTERIAIEQRAMLLAKEWLEKENYTVVDTSRTSPFDFSASRGDENLKVEVKGTTAIGVDAIFMTKNEVDLHREQKGKTALLIVSQIALTTKNGSPLATKGTLTPMVGWDIDGWDATPVAFQLRRRS